MSWQVQEAKQRFSELIDRARAEGPQVVTRHGRPVAVVMDVERYRRLAGEGEDLKALLRSVPAFDPPPRDRARLIDL
jgi:prevent-host-death family protein